MIIGLNGKIGSGKSTVALMIQALTSGGAWAMKPLAYIEAYGDRPNLKGGFQIKGFAHKLKEVASLLIGISPSDLERQDVKASKLGPEWNVPVIGGTRPMLVREFLQKLGTEAIRKQIHPEAWVNALFADYMKVSLEVLPNWVIADMRFINEMRAIQAREGITVRINRKLKQEAYTTLEVLHESETALDNEDFDYVIDNNGSLEDLLLDVTVILTKIGVLPRQPVRI